MGNTEGDDGMVCMGYTERTVQVPGGLESRTWVPQLASHVNLYSVRILALLLFGRWDFRKAFAPAFMLLSQRYVTVVTGVDTIQGVVGGFSKRSRCHWRMGRALEMKDRGAQAPSYRGGLGATLSALSAAAVYSCAQNAA